MVQILRGCGVGWLVVAPIGPLAWEPPYAMGVALKKQQQQQNKLTGKEMRFVIIGGWELWEGELNESGQKLQTLSYKINKFWECNIQHDK